MKNELIVAMTLVASLGSAQAQTQAPNTLTDCEKQEGFQLLFNGSDADSFRKHFMPYKQGAVDTSQPISSAWKYEDATKSITNVQASTPDISSKIMYKDFDMRLQYRNSGNQGVFYRFLTTAPDAWQSGIEVAIEDNPQIANQKTAAGAVYDMFPPSKKNYNTYAGEKWNDLRIIAKGDSVEHWMNGERIISFRYNSAIWTAARANSKWKDFPTYCRITPNDPNSKPISEGYIGIQGNHGGTWKLRSFRINSNAATVGFAAEKPAGSCATDIGGVRRQANIGKLSYERGANAVTLHMVGYKADAVVLKALDGRQVSRGKVDAATQSADLSGWGHPGIYLVQATAAGRVVLSDKIFLQ